MFITNKTIKKITKIHMLSQKINSPKGKNHRKKLLHLAEKHVKEIKYLYGKNNCHADLETGDLLILCLELIIESKKNPDEIIGKCLERYEKKLTNLF